MEDNTELDLNLDDLDQIETNTERKLEVKNRYQKLSEKVKLEAQGKADAETRFKSEEEARLRAEKERDFFKNFSQVSSKHPEAAQYQDQILERVNKGYDMEEAAVAVLAKEGKFGAQAPQAPIQMPENPAGGSAATSVTDNFDKPLEEMTVAEKLQALEEVEKTGELTKLLTK